MPRRCRGIRGDAPQGYLFRFAPLRGHRPLRTSNEGAAGQRLSLRQRSALTPPSQREAGASAPAGAAGRSVEVRRVTGEVQNGRGQNTPSCTAVFALSALFGEKRVHITTVEKGVETVQNPLRKGLGAVA